MEQNARRLAGTWQELPPVRKGLLVGTGLALAGLLFVLYSWSTSSNFVTLYSSLEPSDSSAIVDQLRSRGVDYQLEDGGSRILVPESDLDELRLDFATQGLPEGGHVGFEIFETNAFSLTDFVQRVNFQRGLQGELERTIETFPQVGGARVHLVLPERTLFTEDDQPATASVVLQMRPGQALSSDEVAGVAHLVSGAVSGLDKQDITILDSTGGILYDGSMATQGGIGLASTQQALVRDFESALTRDAQGLLDRSIGAGNSVVTVRATLDFDQVQTETSAYDNQGVPLSQSTTTETYTTTGDGTVGAIPGAVTNVPGANADLPGGDNVTATDTTTGSSTDYSRSESTTNFELPKTLTTSVRAPGDVERLSVALLLDESVPAAQAQALASAVAAAVGLDDARGDSLEMTQVAFDREVVTDAVAAFESSQSTDTILTYARIALPIVVLLVAFFFFRMLMKSLSRRGGFQYQELPAGYDEMPFQPSSGMVPALASGAAGAGMLPPGMPVGAVVEEPPTPEEMKSDLERQVTKLAESHPDTVAEVVQSWLRED